MGGRSADLSTPAARALIVDDNPDLLLLASAAIEARGDIEIVGSTGSGAEVLDLVGRLDPDVVVLDVVLADGDGLEILAQLRAAAPDRPVVVMSGLGESIADEALARGAAAFLPKDAQLVNLLPEALAGAAPRRDTPAERTFVGYHHTVGVLGLAVLATMLAAMGVPQRPGLSLGFAAAAALAYRVPVSVLVSGRAERTVHLTAQIFVAGVLLLPPIEAALAVCLGGGVAIASRRLDGPRTLMSMGALPLQYGAGAAVVLGIGATRPGWEVAAALAASTVTVAVNIAVLAPAVVVGNGVALRRFLASVVPLCTVVWLGAAPVGAAAGLLGRTHLAAMGLMAGPQLVLLAWSAQQVRLQVEQRRVSVLLDTATDAYAARSPAQVEDVLLRAGSTLVGDAQVRITSHRPATGLAVLLDDGRAGRWLSADVAPTPQARRLLEGLAATGSVALQHAARREEDRYAARHDLHTGLANAALFAESVERAVALAERDRGTLAVFYLDLDDFKPVNDRHGHAAGDTVLRAVAQRLQAELRACDLPARLGGDEFAALLPGLGADVAALASIRARIEAAIAAPVDLGTTQVSVTASVGVAVWPHDATEAEALVAAADRSMYDRKSGSATSHA